MVFFPVTKFLEHVERLWLQSHVPHDSYPFLQIKSYPQHGWRSFSISGLHFLPDLQRGSSGYWQVLHSEVEPSCLCHLGTADITSRGFQKPSSPNKLKAVASEGCHFITYEHLKTVTSKLQQPLLLVEQLRQKQRMPQAGTCHSVRQSYRVEIPALLYLAPHTLLTLTVLGSHQKHQWKSKWFTVSHSWKED